MKSKWKVCKRTIPTSELAKTIDEKLADKENPTAKDFLEMFTKTLTDKVAEGYWVNVQELGSFYPVRWEARACSFGDGDIEVKGRNIVMYRASKYFKEKVKNYKENKPRKD